jgi:circadian clock protein KaiC
VSVHDSVVRKLQVVKMRGQGQIPGLHTARITNVGYSAFPRLLKPPQFVDDRPLKHRLTTGVPGLDEMLGGGLPHGYSALIAGPSGSGKTVLSNQFIVDGATHGENGIVAIFEKRPSDYLQTTPSGAKFEQLVREKKLEVVYLRPLDLSIDETLLELQNAVKRVGAKRAVIDSLSGLELALAPTFREDFRESLYRMATSVVFAILSNQTDVPRASSSHPLVLSLCPRLRLMSAVGMWTTRSIRLNAASRRIVSNFSVCRLKGSIRAMFNPYSGTNETTCEMLALQSPSMMLTRLESAAVLARSAPALAESRSQKMRRLNGATACPKAIIGLPSWIAPDSRSRTIPGPEKRSTNAPPPCPFGGR